ncbi:ankyrin repeat domain-containing protein [Persicirhabdus sediminis]|uniref:Ankyrin repeat domain-containing protein n=1 Tax=Persicirhabdus sediminis TaxID=454144 RepID=A0A8J7MB25_9BACT|nr:ankyrin repeat domain-containing protein [Persicirhabdus sediminis]MBK1790239.1 ankyrin repeat domain-containing protein [Persicirhabdus sediminis]
MHLHGFISRGLILSSCCLLLVACGSKAKRELKSRGYDVSELAFVQAAKKGDVVALKHLVAEGIDVGAHDPAGWPAMHVAARAGRFEVIDFLLQLDADINEQGPDGSTALLLVVRDGDPASTKFLLQRHARVDLANKQGETPLSVAISKGSDELIVSLLESAGDQMGSLMQGAVRAGASAEVIQMLVDQGAPLFTLAKGGKTLFMLAAEHGQGDTAIALLEHGICPYSLDDTGKCALQLAEENGHSEVAKQLRSKLSEWPRLMPKSTAGTSWHSSVGQSLTESLEQQSGIISALHHSKVSVEQATPLDQQWQFLAYEHYVLPISLLAVDESGQAKIRQWYDVVQLDDIVAGESMAGGAYQVVTMQRKLVRDLATSDMVDRSLLQLKDIRSEVAIAIESGQLAYVIEPQALLRHFKSGKLYIARRGDQFYSMSGEVIVIDSLSAAQITLTSGSEEGINLSLGAK